jgi:transposase
MHTIHSRPTGPASVGEPERRADERSEAARSEGSPTDARGDAPVPPDAEVTARHARRRFTTAYKRDILRQADACTQSGEIGALLRTEGLYSSHLVTWRQQRDAGLTPQKRGRKATAIDPQVKKLEQENRRLTSRLQKVEALLAFQKKVSELLQIPLKPFVSDEDD